MYSFDAALYIKLGLSTLCYALAFRIVCGGLAKLAEAWKTLRR